MGCPHRSEFEPQWKYIPEFRSGPTKVMAEDPRLPLFYYSESRAVVRGLGTILANRFGTSSKYKNQEINQKQIPLKVMYLTFGTFCLFKLDLRINAYRYALTWCDM